jgi:hypothetical protein
MAEEKPQFQHPQQQTNAPAPDQIFSFDPTDKQQQNQIDKLQNDFNLYKNQRINLNTDIIGLFQTVTVAPTQIPTSPYQQIQIAVLSGTTYLYMYDTTQQTGGSASNGWFRVALS